MSHERHTPPPGSDDVIDVAVHETTATITIQRAERRNALTASAMRGLLRVVADVGRVDQVKAIILRGDGPDFCAGFDISDTDDFEGDADSSQAARIESLEEKATWMRTLLDSPKPLIASVQGNCIGIGFYLVLVSDFAVATSGAGFGLPEERFGSAGATWAYPYLIREVGLKRANEIVMTGRRFSADEIAAFGLVNRVVSEDDLEASTSGLARSLGTLPHEGIAVNRAVKRAALATLGHHAAFSFHPVAHPLAEHLERGADEFDFMARIDAVGLRAAVAERDQAFAGDWWGWNR